jgi:sulfoxide reductase heme-binding subunit YedZ
MQNLRFNKLAIGLNALVPLGFLFWDAYWKQLGTNPIEFFLRTTGVLTLLFLLITLTITPIRKFLNFNGVIKYRRMLGLFAFFYGCIHLTTYFVFDRSFNLSDTVKDIISRPFILVGMTSLFLMIPLAVTSTNAMVKRLGGKRWAQLHKLTYVCAIGGVLHFYMMVKSDVTYPVLFGIVLTGLFAFRLLWRKNPPKMQNRKVEV